MTARGGGDAPSDRLPEAPARSLLAQVVAGVCALSARDIVHHDIKTENILVETDGQGAICRLRLTDLGMSESYGRGARATSFCGSPGFFPPEMVLRRDYDPFKVDTWSVGCVAVELLLGRAWFSAHWLPNSKLTDNPARFEAGLVAALARLDRDLEKTGCSAAAAAFVRAALTLEPADRPTIEALAARPWVAHSPHVKRISRENSTASSTVDLCGEVAPVSEAFSEAAAIQVTPEPVYATIAPCPPTVGCDGNVRRPVPMLGKPDAAPRAVAASSDSSASPQA